MMRDKLLGLIVLLTTLCIIIGCDGRNPCDPVTLSNGIACRCTATYCDDMDLPPPISTDYAVVYTSNEKGLRLEMSTVSVTDAKSTSGITVKLDGSTKQTIIGFGGAFTDAAAYVISLLPAAAQEKLISTYFSRSGGASYSVGRVPVGGADFSRTPYDLFGSTNQVVLKDDNLVAGSDYKLDLIKKAQKEVESTLSQSALASKGVFQVFGSIWSIPVRFKTCDSPPSPYSSSSTNGCTTPSFLFGSLSSNPAIREAYAQYWLDFIKLYEANGVRLWGLTAQNEPAGNPTGNKWDNTNYDPTDLRNFVDTYLGPKLKAAYPDIKIMLNDDQYPELKKFTTVLSTSPSSYVDGLAYHWYFSFAGSLIGTGSVLVVTDLIGGQVEVSNSYKKLNMTNSDGNKFLLMTEACTGYLDNKVEAGSWERGYNYMTSILHELDSGSAGWVDWNIALNMSGGPNYANNQVDSPILVDTTNGVFYKNPMYYTMAHYSAFIPPGAIRLGISNIDIGFLGDWKALEAVAFRKSATSEECIIVIANDHLRASLPIRGISWDKTAVLKLPYGNKQVVIDMPDNTFKTVLFYCPLSSTASAASSVTEESNDDNSSVSGTSVIALAVGGIAFMFIIIVATLLLVTLHQRFSHTKKHHTVAKNLKDEEDIQIQPVIVVVSQESTLDKDIPSL